MSSLLNIALPKPKDWQDFERKTRALFTHVLSDPNTRMHGRNGQPQHGVDIWGYRNEDRSRLVGIQCKLSADEITSTELEVELEKAKAFVPPISEFFLVTTAPRDAKIQETARELTQNLLGTDRPILVEVWGWDDVEENAARYADAWKIFDPTFTPFAEQAHDEVRASLLLLDDRLESIDSKLVPGLVNLCRRPPQQMHREIDRVPGFTGREAELASLERTLWTKGGTAALINARSTSAAVRGLGGVGKSVLAREYAWRKRERYRGIWWLRAEKRETLLDDLIELGARLIPGIKELPEREQAARATLEFIDHAGSEKPWLIVYDNVEQPSDIASLTPRSAAHILITTRWSDWYGKAAELPVDVFTPEVATDFLMEHARRADAQAAARLAASLGYLPLALSHARSYCWARNWDFDQYRTKLSELIHKAPRGAPYPATVFATFDLAIEKAIAQSKEANDLMGIFALVAPDRIPLDVVPDEFMSEIKRGEALAALSEVSLVFFDTLDDGCPAVNVHRLVQEVMRARLASRNAVAEAASITTKLLATALLPPNVNADDPHSWPAFAKLLPHALAALQHAPESGAGSAWTVGLLNQVALYLNYRADYAGAEPMMRRALSLSEVDKGLENSDMPTLLQNLAGLLADTGRYDEAISLIQRAIKIDEMHRGSIHSTVASGMNALAELYRQQGRYEEAVPLQERAVGILEETLGPESPEIAACLNNLATLYQQQGRYQAAEVLYERALASMEKAVGPEHLNVALCLTHAGEFYRKQGRYAEALSLQERAKTVLEKALGPEHPGVAESLNNIGALHLDQGRQHEAETLFKQALLKIEKALGLDHPNVAGSLNNLALLRAQQGRYQEAEGLYERALAIIERARGPEHHLAAENLGNLAALRVQQGRYREAEALQERALAMAEKARGAEHPLVAQCLSNLAATNLYLGRYQQADALYERALAIAEKVFTADHPDLAIVLYGMATQYQHQGRYHEAEGLYERALVIMEKAFGPGHLFVTQGLGNLATLRIRQGRYWEAEVLQERALAMMEKALQPQHPLVVQSLSNLAATNLWLGHHQQAEALYQRALAIAEKVLPPEHPDLATVLYGMATQYQRQRRYPEAERLYKRALVIRQKVLGPEHPEVVAVLSNMVIMYQHQGRHQDEQMLLKQALMIGEIALGTDHPLLKRIRDGSALERRRALFDLSKRFERAPSGEIALRSLFADEEFKGLVSMSEQSTDGDVPAQTKESEAE